MPGDDEVGDLPLAAGERPREQKRPQILCRLEKCRNPDIGIVRLAYHATGTARVRNVILPASYSHIELPRAAHLARQPGVRAWIDAQTPGAMVRFTWPKSSSKR